jgi:hypothetical protein
VASAPNLVNNCGGSPTATAGATSVSWFNPSLVVGSCTIHVNLVATVDNNYTVETTIVSTAAGTATTPSSATLTVINPPVLSKSFNPTTILAGGTSTMTLALSSTNVNLTLSGVGFTDTLPAGMSVASPSNLNNTCGGTVSATGTVALSGSSLAPGAACAVTVTVKGSTVGTLTNSVTPVSANAPAAVTASATLMVNSAPAGVTVTSLTSTTPNGTYGDGANITIKVNFSATVNVTGTPTLALNSGGTAAYSTGTGTAALTFLYTVASGQTTGGGNLDAASTTALSGNITDINGNPATLTVPVGATTGALDTTSAIVINTTAPTVVSYLVDWGTQSYSVIGSPRTRLPWEITGITVVFSKPIGTANINSLSGVTPTAISGLGTNTLTWTIAPIALGNFATALAGSGPNAIEDAGGNPLAGGAGFNQNLRILWGDFNDDGFVNAVDLSDVAAATSQAYNIFADMNGDGVVNAADVAIVHQRVGTSNP